MGKRILAVAMTVAAAGGLAIAATSPASAAALKPVSVGVSPIGELNIVDAAGVNNVKVDITMSSNEVLVSTNAPVTMGSNCRPFAKQAFARTVACRGVTATTALMAGGEDLLQVRALNNHVVAFMGEGKDTVSLYFVLSSSIFGEGGNDNLTGGSGRDFIRGGNDNDTIAGAGGDDNLSGEAGADTVKGGTGQDTIVSVDRNGLKETVNCGANPAGKPDTAVIEAGDKAVDCESVIHF